MRVDVAPFSDVRVRQALRLIVDRQQMIDQALNGFGILGNDLYSPFDPVFASDLPQRVQDIDQAKSLLAQAGQSDLDVELVTSSAVLLLLEAGRIGLEDPIERYSPQLGGRRVLKPGAASLDDSEPAKGSITIRHLLSHSSGLSRWPRRRYGARRTTRRTSRTRSSRR
jgi:hypothetical protein